MEKSKQNKPQIYVDIDAAVDHYNESNPETPTNRRKLSERLELDYQSLTNYQGGKVPKAFGTLMKIVEFTKIEFKNLVKQKSE